VELLSTFPPGLWPKLHSVKLRAADSAEAQLFKQLEGEEQLRLGWRGGK